MIAPTATWICDMLEGLGAAVERKPDGRVDVLLDNPLAESLDLPGFIEADFAASDADRVNGLLRPDFLEKLFRSIGPRGFRSTARVDSGGEVRWPRREAAQNFLNLLSGKSRLLDLRQTEVSYVTVFCRCTALSDEKRETLLSATVNPDTGTVPMDFGSSLEGALERGGLCAAHEEFPALSQQSIRTLGTILQHSADECLGDFFDGLKRRLARDSGRIRGYYDELAHAAVSSQARRKSAPGDVEEHVRAIEGEYRRKSDDLSVKYLTKVEFEPVAWLFLRSRGLMADFEVLMGTKSQTVTIPWNSCTGAPDLTLCKYCGLPRQTIRLCREFHWVCSSCWKRCGYCGKELCPVCRPRGVCAEHERATPQAIENAKTPQK
jgi:hypothetical protein